MIHLTLSLKQLFVPIVRLDIFLRPRRTSALLVPVVPTALRVRLRVPFVSLGTTQQAQQAVLARPVRRARFPRLSAQSTVRPVHPELTIHSRRVSRSRHALYALSESSLLIPEEPQAQSAICAQRASTQRRRAQLCVPTVLQVLITQKQEVQREQTA